MSGIAFPKKIGIFVLFSAFFSLLVLSGCAHEGRKNDALLSDAERLMNKRHFKQAAHILEKISVLDHSNPEAPYLLGESMFRMGNYREAEAGFKEALRKNPNHYNALHRLWASMLQDSYGKKEADDVKEKVRAEINESLKNRGGDSGILFAACMGYYYLKEKDKITPILMELAVKAESDELKTYAASLLFEEVISEREDKRRRLELSKAFIGNFPDATGIDAAAWAFFLSLSELKDSDEDFARDVEGYLSGMKENPYLNYQAAHRLIERKAGIDAALRLLLRNIEEISHDNKPSFFVIKRFKADNYSLLGWAYYMKGMLEEAENSLKAAIGIYKHDGRYHYRLAKVYVEQGRSGEAIVELRNALEIDGGGEGASDLLSSLLKTEYGYEGNPADYFNTSNGVASFREITFDSGLHGVKATEVSWGDFDNDGLKDLFFSGPRLFRNLGEGKFEDVTNDTGLNGIDGIGGGVWGDYDNDGYLDIFMLSPTGNRLMRNIDGKGFKDVTVLAFGDLPPEPSEAAAWGDMNNDGLMDIYIANYELDGVERAICAGDRLWKNNGDGTFGDVSDEAGIASDENMCGRGVVWNDFNNDGKSDILVSNYRLDPNFLWMNNGDSTFTDMAEIKGVQGEGKNGDYGHTIGSAAGDIDGDGDMDIISVNLAHPWFLDSSDMTMVLMNSGPPDYTFKDTFGESGISYEETNSKPALADIDSDGDLDLYITSIYPRRISHLYLNDGHGRFRDVTWLSGARVKNSWEAAFFDMDNDGDADLIAASQDGVRLFMNNGNDISRLIQSSE